MITINKGLDIPISGSPENQVEDAARTRSVALVGYDYIGMKPTMLVKEGERVRTGQVLFTDKKTPGVNYTAPATGVVAGINRGAKRAFESLVIDVEDEDPIDFTQCAAEDLAQLKVEQARKTLLESGLWTALRTRPFSKVPDPEGVASSIFVTAIDTNPLAANPATIIAADQQAFSNGLTVLSRLGSGQVHVITANNTGIVGANIEGVNYSAFAGPHPAGLAGTHIHHIDPVHAGKSVWTIGYQDVIAMGKLFTTGRLSTERIVALAGPVVSKPRLLRTRLGANLNELTAGELAEGENRIISGSVLAGRAVSGALAYLGRYHTQISVLAEGREREFMGWFSAGSDRHSAKPIYLSHWFGKGKKFAMNTNTNGSERAIVPIGAYETVMPLDILATPLLKALAVGDLETAQSLGALELDEEDLGLCSYVCPGKYEFGRVLRDNLTRIEKEG